MSETLRDPAVITEIGPSGGATDDLLQQICADRARYPLPPRLSDLARRLGQRTLELLFPHFSSDARCEPATVRGELAALRSLLCEALSLPGVGDCDSDDVVTRFFDELPALREALLLDAQATFDGDPAAESVDEVILAYPGFRATAMYRVAHLLHRCDVPVLPRLLTEIAHRATGIDIHPGARIGPSFAIDHGTGVVVGETTVIGERVRLYQGVTLGALSVNKRMASLKRHPTVGDDVIIYANATILGGRTTIGTGSRIGGNVWITSSVAPRSVVMPTARVERRSGDSDDDLLEFNI